MRLRLSVLVLAGLCSAPVFGQQPAPPQAEEAAVIEQSRTSIRFDDDGTGRRELYLRIKAQSEAGVQQWGQVVFGYNAATEKLDIQLIRVRKADGTIVDTPLTAIQDLSSPVERIAPVYTDFRQKHATVQSLRPGDTLEVRALTTIHTALAAGQFWNRVLVRRNRYHPRRTGRYRRACRASPHSQAPSGLRSGDHGSRRPPDVSLGARARHS